MNSEDTQISVETSGLISKNVVPPVQECPCWVFWFLVLCGVICGSGIALGYTMWPDINKGCTRYNCSWAVSEFSYCNIKNESAYNCSSGVIYWNVVVNGVASWWVWGEKLDGCGGGCAGGGIATNSTSYPPYPNDTLCYEPVYCRPYRDAPWIRGWNCLPVFYCENGDRITGRLWFVCVMSIVLGLVWVFAMITWTVNRKK